MELCLMEPLLTDRHVEPARSMNSSVIGCPSFRRREGMLWWNESAFFVPCFTFFNLRSS